MTICGCLFLFTRSVNAANENDYTEGPFCSYVEAESAEQNVFNLDGATAAQQNFSRSLCSRETVYVSMEKENLNLYGSRFHNSNKKILLLGIDGTLYKCSVNVYNNEMEGYARAFYTLKDPSDRRTVWDFNVGDDASFLEGVYDALNVTPIEFEVKKEDMKYDTYVRRDDRLINYLSKSEYRIWCFTNALKSKARVILNALGIEEFIEGVVCSDDHAKTPVIKPYKKAYAFVEKLLGVSGGSIFFFDDQRVNIIHAMRRGWNTCMINHPSDDLVARMERLIRINS